MHQFIHKGALAPYELGVVLSSDDPAFDLTTATSAIFRVLRAEAREGEQEDVWLATLSAASKSGDVSSVTVKHPYLLGDTERIGVLQVVAELQTPSGPVVSEAFKILIGSKFAD